MAQVLLLQQLKFVILSVQEGEGLLFSTDLIMVDLLPPKEFPPTTEAYKGVPQIGSGTHTYTHRATSFKRAGYILICGLIDK